MTTFRSCEHQEMTLINAIDKNGFFLWRYQLIIDNNNIYIIRKVK